MTAKCKATLIANEFVDQQAMLELCGVVSLSQEQQQDLKWAEFSRNGDLFWWAVMDDNSLIARLDSEADSALLIALTVTAESAANFFLVRKEAGRLHFRPLSRVEAYQISVAWAGFQGLDHRENAAETAAPNAQPQVHVH